MSGAATTSWARSWVDELARLGVREVVLAPGSRSTPLVMAFARDERFRVRVHLDERSAAFFALGVGKASGVPAAVLTTSGTAAANLFPAVVEASMSAVPLLVLTADRPHHLRDSDANQAIDQVRMFGRYVRDFFDVAPPVEAEGPLRHLRSLAARVVSAATGPTAGPVHVNFPFDKPLEPVERDGGSVAAGDFLGVTGRPDGAPIVAVSTGVTTLSEDELDVLAGLLNSPRGVIVAGRASEPGVTGPAALALAAGTRFPVLADPLSGARFGPAAGAERVAAYDLFLGDAEVVARTKPSVVVRVGAAPTSTPLQRWLAHHADVPQIVIDAGARWKDHAATAVRYVRADPAATLHALATRATRSASEDWVALWADASKVATDALAEAAGGDDDEGAVLAAVAGNAPADAALFVSSSMPVRDLDGFAHPADKPLAVWGNRGASGIDGIVSTAFGIASQRGGPTICAIGDIAFFHDQNGLLWSRESDAAVVFVLIDNDGGGIFHMLPIAEHEPHFTDLFATPHGLDLEASARLHGIAFTDVPLSEIGEAVSEAVQAGTTRILRVRTDRDAAHARRSELRARVCARVRESLDS